MLGLSSAYENILFRKSVTIPALTKRTTLCVGPLSLFLPSQRRPPIQLSPFLLLRQATRGTMSFDPLSPSAAPSWPSSPHQPSDLPPHLSPSSPAMSPSNSRSFSSSMAQQQAQGPPPPQMGALGSAGDQYAKERQVSSSEQQRAREGRKGGGRLEEGDGRPPFELASTRNPAFSRI